jgi:LPS O-antigen subunit length determinant protein (WzzB/FepE family)
LALGGAMMTTGVILLQRFIREYPLESRARDE